MSLVRKSRNLYLHWTTEYYEIALKLRMGTFVPLVDLELPARWPLSRIALLYIDTTTD